MLVLWTNLIKFTQKSAEFYQFTLSFHLFAPLITYIYATFKCRLVSSTLSLAFGFCISQGSFRAMLITQLALSNIILCQQESTRYGYLVDTMPTTTKPSDDVVCTYFSDSNIIHFSILCLKPCHTTHHTCQLKEILVCVLDPSHLCDTWQKHPHCFKTVTGCHVQKVNVCMNSQQLNI